MNKKDIINNKENWLNELLETSGLDVVGQDVVLSEAIRLQQEAENDGEIRTLEDCLYQAIADYKTIYGEKAYVSIENSAQVLKEDKAQSDKEIYGGKDLFDIAKENEQEKQPEERKLPYPELGPDHYLNASSEELNNNMAEDREERDDLYRR